MIGRYGWGWYALVALAAGRGTRRAGGGTRGHGIAPRGRRHRDHSLAATCTQRLRALDPPRHADGLELIARDIEERTGALPIPVRPEADLHPGLVEVDERAQRARALLVEDGARPLEPIVRLARAPGERTELRHRQARVGAHLAEVTGERLGQQGPLQDAGEVGSTEPPERKAAAAEQRRVAADATPRALDGRERVSDGAQRIIVTSGEGEQNCRDGVRRGTIAARCRIVAREGCLGGGHAELDPRTARIGEIEQCDSTLNENVRRVSRTFRQLGDPHEIPLGRGEVTERRAQAGAHAHLDGGGGQLTSLEVGVSLALRQRQCIAIRAGPEDVRAPYVRLRSLERGPARFEDVPVR